MATRNAVGHEAALTCCNRLGRAPELDGQPPEYARCLNDGDTALSISSFCRDRGRSRRWKGFSLDVVRRKLVVAGDGACEKVRGRVELDLILLHLTHNAMDENSDN